MKIPMSPPDLSVLFRALPQAQIEAAMRSAKPVVDGRYLHWDNLRHRRPPAGLSHEAWWLGVKFSRLSVREQMPLVDEQGEPFFLVYVPAIRRGLHHIDQSLGARGPSPGPPRVEDLVETHGRKYLLGSSLMEEAIRSSQLEGASTTRARAKDMIRERRQPRDRSERMILNNFAAMERIEELAGQALAVETVRELHSMLTEGTLDDPGKAGVFRTVDDEVVVELLNSIDTAHVPPPAEELPERMERLLAFANGDTPDEWIHPVLRSIVLHFMIGYDHPFVDGNGRVARALFYWAMLRHGYPLAKFLSISKVLREAPARYARAYLHTETDGGDLTYFVDHHLQVIAKSIDALGDYVTRKVAATRQVETDLRHSTLNHRQVRLIGHALRHPGFEYSVKSHQTSHGVVTNTARADLDELARMGLLKKSRSGRRHVFIAPDDLEERLRRINSG